VQTTYRWLFGFSLLIANWCWATYTDEISTHIIESRINNFNQNFLAEFKEQITKLQQKLLSKTALSNNKISKKNKKKIESLLSELSSEVGEDAYANFLAVKLGPHYTRISNSSAIGITIAVPFVLPLSWLIYILTKVRERNNPHEAPIDPNNIWLGINGAITAAGVACELYALGEWAYVAIKYRNLKKAALDSDSNNIHAALCKTSVQKNVCDALGLFKLRVLEIVEETDDWPQYVEPVYANEFVDKSIVEFKKLYRELVELQTRVQNNTVIF